MPSFRDVLACQTENPTASLPGQWPDTKDQIGGQPEEFLSGSHSFPSFPKSTAPNMRLLNTTLSAGQFELHEFVGDQIPKYAILSHTWGDGEITLQDAIAGRGQGTPSHVKVENCCARAKADGFDYVWVDTCCIDKTSSAELSEAINSMYLWYENAEVCYAYLADVSPRPSWKAAFRESRWFTRGWTLQELIAPSKIIFFVQGWQEIGTKASLREAISARTGIPVSVLSGDPGGIDTASIAQKMSWAAGRRTARVEDIAYCLLGIFSVNMPLIYGEGERAFIRLQEEILKISDDQSLFAWQSEDDRGGLLATGPLSFASSGSIVSRRNIISHNEPVTVSSLGIHLTLPVIGLGHGGLALGFLSCSSTRYDTDHSVAIYLQDTLLTMERFERVLAAGVELIGLKGLDPSVRPIRRLCVKLGRFQGSKKRSHEFPRGHHTGDSGPNVCLDTMLQAIPFEQSVHPNTPENRARLLDAARRGEELEVCQLLHSGFISADTRDEDDMTPLMHAAAAGATSMVWLLLSRSDVQLDAVDINGWTPLSLAAREGHEVVCKILLARKSKLVDNSGRTPLSHAAETGQVSLVRFLIFTAHFEPDLPDKAMGKLRPLDYALERKYDGIVELLIGTRRVDVHSMVGNPKRDLLEWAIERNNHAVVVTLLERGVDLERKYGPEERTPLALAVSKQNYFLSDLLLQFGARVDTVDKSGRTLVALAAMAGRGARGARLVHLLIDHGAQFDGSLSLAVTARSVSVVEALLVRGARMEAAARDGKTLLVVAVEDGNTPLAEVLIDGGAGAEIEQRGESGQTPLELAVWKGDGAMVQLLLERRAEAEPNMHVLPSATVLLFLAVKKGGCKRIVSLLLDWGATINARGVNNTTPLFWAVQEGNEEATMLLLEKGALVIEAAAEGRNAEAATLLDCAICHGHAPIVRLLLGFLHTESPTIEKESTNQLLLTAICHRQAAVVGVLLDSGAPVRVSQDRHSAIAYTALLQAGIHNKKKQAVLHDILHRLAEKSWNDFEISDFLWYQTRSFRADVNICLGIRPSYAGPLMHGANVYVSSWQRRCELAKNWLRNAHLGPLPQEKLTVVETET